MAHYLLKKRVMMELKQQQEQDQQQQQQKREGKQKQLQLDKDNNSSLERVEITSSKIDTKTGYNSGTDLLTTPSDGNKPVDVSSFTDDYTEAAGVLNLSKKVHSSVYKSWKVDQASVDKERLQFKGSEQDKPFTDTAPSSTPLFYHQGATSELETLNEKEEKQRLISKIVSIVRETVKVPISGLDLGDKSMLHCMNILSNPLCELNNCGMMHLQGSNQAPGVSSLSMPGGASTSGDQMAESVSSSSRGFGPLLSESSLWPVRHHDIAQLAMSRPMPSKQQVQDPSHPDNIMSGLTARNQPHNGDAYGMNGYQPSPPSTSPSSHTFMSSNNTLTPMSGGDGVEPDVKPSISKLPYVFGSQREQVNEFLENSGPRETSDSDNGNLASVDLGHRGTMTSGPDVPIGINIMKTNNKVFGSKEPDTHSFVSERPGEVEFNLSSSEKADCSKSQSFPDQVVYSQNNSSFHGCPERQLSPLAPGSHQNSPGSGSICDSSNPDHQLFENFASAERESASFLPVSSTSTSTFEPCGLPGCPLTSSPSTVTAGQTAGTQQNVISSSSCTTTGGGKPTGTKRRHPSSVDPSLTGYPVTSSGRNKGLGKTNEPKFDCQVCGDLAAGFHCGAYVCEACKKFYLRCLKNDQNLLTCPKSQRCDINKENRSHCQYCRYQKCISLGMYRPGREDDKNLKVNFKAIPCKVCGASSSGFHFGAITCEGCKGFFRRMLKENLHQKFTCSSGNSCDITSANRTFCKACRFNKCVKIGMTLEGTRLGRQSNSMKRNTLMAYKMREFDGPPAKVVAPNKIKVEPIDNDYQPEPSTFNRSTERIKDVDCSIVEDFNDVPLEVIGTLEFDSNLLDVSESTKAKSLAENMTKNIKANGSVKLENGVTSFNEATNTSDQLPAQSGKFGSHSPSVPLSPNRSSESLGVTWDGVFSVSENSNHAELFTESGTISSRDQDMSWLPKKHDMPKICANKTLTKASQNLPVNYQNTGSDQDNLTSISKPSLPSTRLKQVGVEIYSDPERLTSYLVDIYNILDGMKEIPESMKQYKLEVGNPQNIWNFTMQGFVHNSYIMLRFLKSIPGFRTLPQDKQIKLCQETIYPISLLYHSQGYDLKERKIKFFCYTDEVRELLFKSFPNFRGMMNHFEQCGRWMAEMKIDRVELAFLTVIFVLRATEQTIRDPGVRGYLETTTDILIKYCDKKDSVRGGVLLARMAELERASFEHHQMAALTIKQNPHMSFGQLWQEIFIPE